MIPLVEPELNVLLAVAWLAAGGVAAATMLRVFGGAVPAERRDRVAALHRWAGRTFAALYLVILVSMAFRLRESGVESAGVAIHGTLGFALLPLLVVKILIARSWKPLHKLLPSLGIFISVLAFTTLALGASIYWIEGDESGNGQVLARVRDLPGRPEAKRAFEAHCGECHALSRPLERAQTGSLTAEDWKRTIAKMAVKARKRGIPVWTAAEEALIVELLVAQSAARPEPLPGGAEGGEGGEERRDRGRGRGRGRGRESDD
jgi:hypothetical protein